MTGKGNLHVWLLDLEVLRPALEGVERRAGLLADDERTEGAMGHDDAARTRRAVRIALRLLLAREGLGRLASQPLQRGPSGKPRLAGAVLDFSISHAGGHALIALSRSGPVGVDLEPRRTVLIREPRRSQIAAAGAALARTAGDRPDLGEPEELQLLRAWTRLEAYAKARGSGIGNLLTDLGLSGHGSRAASPEAAAKRAQQLSAAEGLAVVDLALPSDLVGALATRPGAVTEGLSVARLTVEDCAAVARLL
jgi:4'-phosphopantetheinyl transferase